MLYEVITVLIVDDEVRSLESLERILGEDFDVKIASSVQEAEALLQTEWVQIILCDQRMPDTTGVEFLTRVREQWPDVIRMIISGYTDSEDIINALNEAGVYQYITKPWHPENVITSYSIHYTKLYEGAIGMQDLLCNNDLDVHCIFKMQCTSD